MVNHASADSGREDVEALRAEVVLEASEIDSSTVEVGAFAVVVYRQGRPHPILRGWEKLVMTRGYVQAVDAETLTPVLEQNGRPQRIALDRIQKLTLVESPSSEAADRDSAQIDASHADGLLKETPDTLSVKTDDMGTSKRIASKLVAGTLSGIGGFFGGFVVGAILDSSGWTPLILGTWGYPVGSAIGVSLVDPHDHFIYSLIGSLLGAGVAAPTASDINFLIFPPICAMLASELFRKPPETRRFSIGLVPNPKGRLSAVATLRF